MPLNINFVISDQFEFSTGGFVDFYIYGKHKRKYFDDGNKERVLVEPKDFKDFNLNKMKYGVSASIIHKKTNIGIAGTYYPTPFFQDGMGPELNEVRISLFFRGNPNSNKLPGFPKT